MQAQLAAVQAQVPEPVDPAAAACLRGRYGAEVAQLRGWLREVLLVSAAGMLPQWGGVAAQPSPVRLMCKQAQGGGQPERARSSGRWSAWPVHYPRHPVLWACIMRWAHIGTSYA